MNADQNLYCIDDRIYDEGHFDVDLSEFSSAIRLSYLSDVAMEDIGLSIPAGYHRKSPNFIAV